MKKRDEAATENEVMDWLFSEKNKKKYWREWGLVYIAVAVARIR